MALTVTLSQLVGRVRFHSDTVNSPTPTDATISGGINASLRALYARIAEGGAEFLVTSTTLTTAADVGSYNLPDDFWKLRSVTWKRGVRDHVPLFRFEDRDRASFENQQWSSGARYRLSDVAFGGTPTIELCPPPDAAYEVRIGYVPDPPTVDGGADLVCNPGMDEWIVLDVVCRILAAEESDVSVWASLRDDVWRNEIVPSLALRDEARTVAISDCDVDAGRF